MVEKISAQVASSQLTELILTDRSLSILAMNTDISQVIGGQPVDPGMDLSEVIPELGPFKTKSTGDLSRKGGTLSGLMFTRKVQGKSQYFEIQALANPLDLNQLIFSLTRRPDYAFFQNPEKGNRVIHLPAPDILLKRRIRELDTLHELADSLSSCLDVEALLDRLVMRGADTLGADSCSLLVHEHTTGDLVYRAASIKDLIGMRIPSGKGIVQAIFKSGKPISFENYRDGAEYQRGLSSALDMNIKNIVGVPVFYGRNRIGVLIAANKFDGKFDLLDQSILATLASYAGIAIHSARLRKASAKRSQNLHLLSQASSLLDTTPPLKAFLPRLAGLILANTATQMFSISKWESGSKNLNLMAYFPERPVPEPGEEFIDIDLEHFPLTRAALEENQPVLVRNGVPGAGRKEITLLREFKARSAIFIPFVFRKKVSGLLQFFSQDPGGYTSKDLHLYRSLGHLISVAVEKSAPEEVHVHERLNALKQLIQEQSVLVELERQQRELAETLREAAAIVAATLDMNEAIEWILPQLARVVPFDGASVQLLKGDVLEIVGGRGWIQENDVVGYRFPVPGPNPNTLVVNQKRPVILNQEELSWYEDFQKATHGSIKSWLGVPLVVHEEVIGMLALDSTETRFFTLDHAEIVKAFADQVAVAIEQAQMFQRTQEAVQELDALRSIIADITGELELNSLLTTVLERASQLLKATSGELALFRPERQRLEIVACHNMGMDFTGATIKLGEGLLGHVAVTKQPLLLENYRDWERSLRGQAANAGPWFSTIAVPLEYRQRLIGVMTVVDNRPERKFNRSDLQLLELFSHQVSIAIDNAQLFQQVQHLATTDDLTALPNRRELFNIGNELFNQAKRLGHDISAIMFDIDHFKIVNDTYGHSVGDQVLKGIAKICTANVRDIDILGRYGGEEFTLILPHTSMDAALTVAERLRLNIETSRLKIDREQISITISLGVATINEKHKNLAELLDEADTALYIAKNNGRNQVHGITD